MEVVWVADVATQAKGLAWVDAMALVKVVVAFEPAQWAMRVLAVDKLVALGFVVVVVEDQEGPLGCCPAWAPHLQKRKASFCRQNRAASLLRELLSLWKRNCRGLQH